MQMTDDGNTTQNLLEETISALHEHGHATDDVLHVRNENMVYSWELFAHYAKEVIYDSGFGANLISLALEIVGKGWKLV